jgi:hypothetical protein
MKKLLLIAIATSVVFGQLFCSSINAQRIACEQTCKTAQNTCKKDSDKIANAAQRTAKNTACDAAHQKCLQECNK